MLRLIRWALVGLAFAVLNLAALPYASAVILRPAASVTAAGRADFVLARHGGKTLKFRNHGGGRSYSGGRSLGRLHKGGDSGRRIVGKNSRRNYAVNSGHRFRKGSDYMYRGQMSRRQIRRGNFHGGKRYLGDGRNYRKHASYDRKRHGNRYHHKHGKYRHYHDGYWYAWPWWLGVGIGTYYGGYWDAPVYEAFDPHVDWCLRRYRSYNPATDAYLGFDGYYHRCISPYS